MKNMVIIPLQSCNDLQGYHALQAVIFSCCRHMF